MSLETTTPSPDRRRTPADVDGAPVEARSWDAEETTRSEAANNKCIFSGCTEPWLTFPTLSESSHA